MKRFLSVLCVILLALSLTACGGKENPQSRSEKDPSSVLEPGPKASSAQPTPDPGPSSSEPGSEEADPPEEPSQPSRSEEDPGPSEEPESGSEEKPLYFSLGRGGEVKALHAGDTLGGWTLQSYDATWDVEGRDIPLVDKAVFTAPTDASVEINCTVSLDPMSSDRNYWFTVAEEDLDKMPVMEGDSRDVWFSGNNSADLTALADLGSGETWSCRVALSRYTFVCLPMMSSNGAEIVWLELE